MKFCIHLICFLSLQIGVAQASQEKDEPQIPNTAELWYQTNANNIHASGSDMERSILYYLYENAEAKDPNFNCQAIYRNWNLSTDRGVTTVRVAEYCEPRSLVQKQILSTSRMCEATPKDICYTKEYLDYLSKFEKTKTIDINKPNFNKIGSVKAPGRRWL